MIPFYAGAVSFISLNPWVDFPKLKLLCFANKMSSAKRRFILFQVNMTFYLETLQSGLSATEKLYAGNVLRVELSGNIIRQTRTR